VAVLLALVALAHLPWARPLLARISGRGGGCPLGFDAAPSPAQARASLAAYARRHRGVTPAKARPALGLPLERATREDVRTWANVRGLTCHPARDGSLTCEASARASAAVQLQEGTFRFAPDGGLLSVTVVRTGVDAARVAEKFGADVRELETLAGPATAVTGRAEPAVLASAPLRQASREFRYRNYYALLRATNLGDHFALTEEFHALVP
jgi:hypothetical protein